jgi:uncharacterized protein YjbI with pentapeptide repeats
MASQKQLDLLSSGRMQWNRWRRTSPDVQSLEPDLHGADLHDADLHGADLHGADLTEANLKGADLREADLREADLRNADLSNANLSDAILLNARLHWANVRGATLLRTNLKGADLSNTDLRGADLRGADLKRAMLDNAKCDEANAPGEDPSEANVLTHLDAKERKLGSVAIQDDDASLPPRQGAKKTGTLPASLTVTRKVNKQRMSKPEPPQPFSWGELEGGH